jgi:predicted DNA-binding WGR domain protein
MRNDSPCDLAGSNVILERIRPELNERRFYAMSVTTDLFGNTLLFRNWGRIGTGGRICFDHHPGIPEAITAMTRLATKKQRRGYQHRGRAALV